MKEPKPVVTREGDVAFIDGAYAGVLVDDGSGTSRIAVNTELELNSAELRALAHLLDQWDGATLLSQVVER